jgi:competence/damage-inducible protein CinA-like protein
MISAEVITIGTEIMLGEILDTNAPHIARQLRDIGVDVSRTWSIADDTRLIATAIQEARQRARIIITTGGLGPTVDDPTREAVALSFGVQTEFRDDLWQQVIERFKGFDLVPSENNRRQAYVPENAIAIENPVGTAPSFMMPYTTAFDYGAEAGLILCLPGVPREMEYLMQSDVLPELRTRFSLSSVRLVRILRTAGVGESMIDEKIGDLELQDNPSVGLSAHSGAVDIRISALGATQEIAEALVAETESEVRARLGDWIYGADSENLGDSALARLDEMGWDLCVLEAGLEGKLLRQFASRGHPAFRVGLVMPDPPDNEDSLAAELAAFHKNNPAKVALGIALDPGDKRQHIYLALRTPDETKALRISYGGPPKLAGRRAINYAMDILRKL